MVSIPKVGYSGSRFIIYRYVICLSGLVLISYFACFLCLPYNSPVVLQNGEDIWVLFCLIMILSWMFTTCRGSFELAAGIAGQLGIVPLAVHGIYASTAGSQSISCYNLERD
jgi:hypothetical protein